MFKYFYANKLNSLFFNNFETIFGKGKTNSFYLYINTGYITQKLS